MLFFPPPLPLIPGRANDEESDSDDDDDDEEEAYDGRLAYFCLT